MKEDNLSLRNFNSYVISFYMFWDSAPGCGMKLQGDDPVGMKNFIQSIQSRVNELKGSSESGQSNISSKRNNKKISKEDTIQFTWIKKWLQKWSTLLDPNKKGQWWLSGDVGASILSFKISFNVVVVLTTPSFPLFVAQLVSARELRK